MLVTGKANWWLPEFLNRVLPRLNVEGSVPDYDHRPAPAPPGTPAQPLRPVTETSAGAR
jgi:RND superfamily putative drug exporter